MAPFSFMTAGVSCLAKSFSLFSCTSAVARCASVLPATYINPVKCLTSQASGPPKRPLTGYMRFFVQQTPSVSRQNPGIKPVDLVRRIAQQWKTMSPEQKQPFQEASQRAREQYKLDFEHYQAQLTPAQIQQQDLERKQKKAKRKAIRKKRELNSLGKPKRPRSPFNIYMAEHFEEARGATLPAKMKSLSEDWKNLFNHQRKVYTQLAEDDKVRYKNEIKSWEEHMVEIGREDLLREHTRPKVVKTTAAKKGVKKATVTKKATTTAKATRKTTATKGKSETARKTTKRTTKKTV